MSCCNSPFTDTQRNKSSTFKSVSKCLLDPLHIGYIMVTIKSMVLICVKGYKYYIRIIFFFLIGTAKNALMCYTYSFLDFY